MKYFDKLGDFLFIIPARSGSKGIKNKNLIKVNKKSLIEYTFEILKKIKSQKKYLISDSEKIKKLANKYKINTDYVRPISLSKDETNLIKNLIHFNSFIKNKNTNFKYYVILQPTSPLRKFDDLNKAIKKFLSEKLESLFSISQSQEHPNETFFLKKNKINFFIKEKQKLRQQYKESFFINGAIYIFKKDLIRKNKIISKKKHGYFKMKKIRSFDLDDYEDLEIVKKLI
jgi:CMP-N,N'-diacetyllegionaminic acid synthase